MARFIHVLGTIWLGILALTVAVGALSILLFQGIWKFWEIFSPFNIWNWGLIAILALPGIGLWKLGDRLQKKED